MQRRITIGGSEIAAICGLSPFAGPAQIYDKKIHGTTVKSSLKMRAGVALEAGIVDLWLREGGHPSTFAIKPWPKSIVVDGWRRASADRLLADGGGLEIKFTANADGKFGRTGTNMWPDYYRAQCAWYASAYNAKYWRLVALVYGTNTGRSTLRLAEYVYERDPQYEGWLIGMGRKFMDEHILAKSRPCELDVFYEQAEPPAASGQDDLPF